MIGGFIGRGIGNVPRLASSGGVLLAVEAADTAVFIGTAATVGVLNALEKQDRALFLPPGANSGIMDAYEEGFDTALFIGTAHTLGLLSAVEASDTALFTGSGAFIPISGILRASELPDRAFFFSGRLESNVPSPVPQSPWDCLRHTPPRRRVFWTTQQEACGTYFLCGHQCAIPGLVYEGDENGRTIVNTEWLQSLILNILNTRARTDVACPTPAATYGHWSESYRDDGLHIGSRMWNAAARGYTRVADAVKMIDVMVKGDLQKLIQMGVANKVDVTTVYNGHNSVMITVTATSLVSGNLVMNLSGTFAASGWEWR